MEIQGQITLINEAEVISRANIDKRTFVIQTAGQYAQDIEIELVKDAVTLLNNFKVGDEVNVSINIRGRKWTNPEGVDKYFISLQGWKISAINAPKTDIPLAEEQDDLPF